MFLGFPLEECLWHFNSACDYLAILYILGWCGRRADIHVKCALTTLSEKVGFKCSDGIMHLNLHICLVGWILFNTRVL